MEGTEKAPPNNWKAPFPSFFEGKGVFLSNN